MENKVIISSNEVLLFQSPDHNVTVEPKLFRDTVWLSLNELTALFGVDKSGISRHIKNIFRTEELDRNSVVAFFATTAADSKIYKVEHFNLDMIISVGYHVNSKRGTQFRIWATGVLRDHLIKGYTVNEKRLQSLTDGVKNLKNSITIIERTLKQKALSDKETYDLVQVISDYAQDLKLLDDYDNQTISKPESDKAEISPLTYEEVIKIIKKLKSIHKEMLFGLAKDSSLDSSINAIYQTFDGKDVYPSLSEKAANLLYLLTKNHPFVDGNKRIAASIFLYFLNKNQILYNAQNDKIMADGILAAITLLVAESKPQEKDTMINIIMHYLGISGGYS
jgi:prophage maintenance system killer protein